MNITQVDLYVVRIPMTLSVKHALAERNVAENVIVRMTDEQGNQGYGECCPRDYVTGENIDSVKHTLSTIFIPHLLEQTFADFEQCVSYLRQQGQNVTKKQLAAFCALELALLDLAGHKFKCDLTAILGPIVRPKAKYSAVIATEQSQMIGQMCAVLNQYQVDEVKVKLVSELDKNKEILTQIKQAMPQAELRGDANAAWDSKEAISQLADLAEFGLQGIEQPVHAEPREEMIAVTAGTQVDVVADESLCSFDDARNLVRNKGCDIFNLRVSKCGGLIATLRLYHFALENGLQCQMGAQVGETGILSAAGRQLACRLQNLRWLEGSYGKFLLADDVTEQDLTIGPMGLAPALEGVGLGVTVDSEKLQQFHIYHQQFCR